MIGIITFILSLVILGILFGVFNFSDYVKHKEVEERDYRDRVTMRKISETNYKLIVKAVAVFLVSLILSAINPYEVERVDSGKVAILVDNIGDNKGIAKVEYKRGWVLYNSFSQRYYEFPVYQQHIDYEENTVITKGGFQATIKPSFNYSLNPTTVDQMFQNLRLDIKQVEQGWLKNAIVSSVNDVANLFTVDSIFNHRAEFETAIITECNKRVGKWFTVSQLRTNIAPPPAITKAIEEKTKAVQEAQAALQRKAVAEAEAAEKVAIAKGDSAKVVISAAGQARANQLIQQSLTNELVQKMWIEKWDGKLPQYQLGSGNGLMLNLGKQ
jgi:regulator of protease activity HflC (stomatin/prohibitin superfamily)